MGSEQSLGWIPDATSSIVTANLPGVPDRADVNLGAAYSRIPGYYKSMFVVYLNPSDIQNFKFVPKPGRDFYVVREWLILRSGSGSSERLFLAPRPYTMYEGYWLEKARDAIKKVKRSAMRSSRFRVDDVAILETWY